MRRTGGLFDLEGSRGGGGPKSKGRKKAKKGVKAKGRRKGAKRR